MKFNLENHTPADSNLERIPNVVPEIIFALQDVSRAILNKEYTDQDIDGSIALVFSELQDLDKDIVSYFDHHRSNNRISKQQALIVTILFLASLQVGPDMRRIRQEFLNPRFSEQEFDELLKNISLPQDLRLMVGSVYKLIRQ